ncbi:MAG: M50 family metallopeptidase [Anaerolineae bacterium]|nr:M50 family metallopeptidase [Anaerolineae bacterium]
MTSEPLHIRRRSLLIAIAAIIVAIIVWNIPALDFLLYPFRLFVTFIHETAHGLTAILTGGQLINLTVYSSGAGVATTAGGARWLILPAGYLGAALFGAVLFYLTNTIRRARWISGALAIMMAIMALTYTNFLSTAWLVGLGFAAVLAVLAYKGSRELNLAVLNFLAVLTALNAVVDLFSLVQYSNASMGEVRNDAAAFSANVFPLIPPAVWAVCWAAIAVLMLGLAVWYSYGRRAKRHLDSAYNSIKDKAS